MNEETLFELQVDDESGNYFKEAARWTNFISILYFTVTGILALAALFSGAFIMGVGSTMLGSSDLGAPGAGILATVFIVLIAIVVVMAIMLYRFANMIRTGIERQDQAAFNAGLRALKNYFVVYGVIVVLTVLSSISRLF